MADKVDPKVRHSTPAPPTDLEHDSAQVVFGKVAAVSIYSTFLVQNHAYSLSALRRLTQSALQRRLQCPSRRQSIPQLGHRSGLWGHPRDFVSPDPSLRFAIPHANPRTGTTMHMQSSRSKTATIASFHAPLPPTPTKRDPHSKALPSPESSPSEATTPSPYLSYAASHEPTVPSASSISTPTCTFSPPSSPRSLTHPLNTHRHQAPQSLRRRARQTSRHQPRHLLLPRPRRRPTRQRHQHPRRHPHHPLRPIRLRQRRLLRFRNRRSAGN